MPRAGRCANRKRRIRGDVRTRKKKQTNHSRRRPNAKISYLSRLIIHRGACRVSTGGFSSPERSDKSHLTHASPRWAVLRPRFFLFPPTGSARATRRTSSTMTEDAKQDVVRKLITIFLDVPHDLIVTFTRDLERSASPAVQFVGSGGGAPDRRRHRALISHPPPSLLPRRSHGHESHDHLGVNHRLCLRRGLPVQEGAGADDGEHEGDPPGGLRRARGQRPRLHRLRHQGPVQDDLIGRVEFELFTNSSP